MRPCPCLADRVSLSPGTDAGRRGAEPAAPAADGSRILHFREIDSTNSEIARRAENGAADGLVVIADYQAAGRGRRGRSWRSKPGNLAMSILVRDVGPLARAAELSFAAVLAAHDALCLTVRDADGNPILPHIPEGQGAFPLHLKWPNDLLLHGRKLGGVLLEMDGPRDAPRVIVGIGINLHDFPPDARYPATALGVHGLSCDRNDLAQALIGCFDVWRARRLDTGFSALRTAWIARAATDWQGSVTLNLDGNQCRGRILDLDHDGALLFRPEGEDAGDAAGDHTAVRRITAGEVCFGPVSSAAPESLPSDDVGNQVHAAGH